MSQELLDAVTQDLITKYDLDMDEAREMVEAYVKDYGNDFDDMEIDEIAEAVYKFSN
jgi:uncharacterized protein YpuA (DUF1002 family)